jgi:hypothetical protein
VSKPGVESPVETEPDQPDSKPEGTATVGADVMGEERFGYKILRVESPSVANAIAALLLRIRDQWHVMPHIYFAWAEGNPFYFLFRYLISGEGDVPPVTREVLRRAEPDRSNRPWVHVG